MNSVVSQSGYCLKLLGEPEFKKNKKYRKIKYNWVVPVAEGALVFNALTGELLQLSHEEFAVFNGESENDEITAELIKKWLFVEQENDDLQLSNQLSELTYMFSCSRHGMPLNHFVILPTTDCNARCFYCFELAGRRRNMTEQTAHDVADFIERKRNPKEMVHLRWFGGEPLYNDKAIDIICNDLAAKGIEYDSVMVSNGYLFDREMVDRAVNLWKLHTVQITIDGTEEIYNRVKAYIYKGVNAFQKVLEGVELLLEAGVTVRIRMNMDDHNEDDLFSLTDQLLERFSKYGKFSLYPHLLFEDSCARIAARAEDERHHLIEAQIRLRNKISGGHQLSRSLLKPASKVNHCMADSDSCTMILPDGNLGCCQHFTDDHYYGSIYSDEIDLNIINEFKRVGVIDPNRCDSCELRPYCLCLQACLIIPHRCDDFDKKLKVEDLETKMLNSYELFKNKEK